MHETAHVLDPFQDVKRHGLSVILTMHNLEHVLAVAERAIVMRQGRRRGTVDIAGPQDGGAHDRIIRSLT